MSYGDSGLWVEPTNLNRPSWLKRSQDEDSVALDFLAPSAVLPNQSFNRELKRLWNEAAIQPLLIDYPDGVNSVAVSADWSDVVSQIDRQLQFVEAIESRLYNTIDSLERNLEPIFRINLKATYKKSGEGLLPCCEHAAEVYLSDCFLAFNIAHPCTFSLLGSRFASRARNEVSELNLRFTTCQLQFLDPNDSDLFPRPLQSLSLDQVFLWLRKVRRGYEFMGNSPAQRALHALLYFFGEMDISPSSIMWLSHALESLLDTKPGSNLASMRDRTAVIFSLTETERGQVNRNLRKFYELRSKFVHGELRLAHPLSSPDLDSKIGDYWDEVRSCVEFAGLLVLNLLQRLVSNNATQYLFTESFSYLDTP